MGSLVLPARRVLEKPVCFSRRLSPPNPFSHWSGPVGGCVSIGQGAVSVWPGCGRGLRGAELALVSSARGSCRCRCRRCRRCRLSRRRRRRCCSRSIREPPPPLELLPPLPSPLPGPRDTPSACGGCCLHAPPLLLPLPSVTYPLLAALVRTFSDTPASLHHLLGQPRQALGLAVRAQRKASSDPVPA